MEWFSVKEMASLEHSSEATIRRWIKEGTLIGERTGRRWRVARRPGSDQLLISPVVHQETLRELLGYGLNRDVEEYRSDPPSVWAFSFRVGDPSNGLRLIRGGENECVDWQLDIELDPDWKYARAHLATGLENLANALEQLRQTRGKYWRIISDAETHYRAQVERKHTAGSHALNIDDSSYFRSIVAEADRTDEPQLSDYPQQDSGDRVLVHLTGRGIFNAAGPQAAEAGMRQHLAWRRGFRRMHLAELQRLRTEMKAAAEHIVSVTSRFRGGALVPGSCELCTPSSAQKRN